MTLPPRLFLTSTSVDLQCRMAELTWLLILPGFDLKTEEENSNKQPGKLQGTHPESFEGHSKLGQGRE